MTRVVLMALLACVFTAPAGPAGARTWNSNDGQHAIDAEFVRVEDGKVTLKRPDGSVVAVKLERLSDADRQFVASLNPAKEKSNIASPPSDASPSAAPGARAAERIAARKTGWNVAMVIVGKLESGDQRVFPGIQAWLEDFRKKTEGIDLKASPEKQPLPDVDALVAHNPNFWRAYYEIAPGDPGLALLHAGLLLVSDEPSRAIYVLDFARFSPGIPKEMRTVFAVVQAAARRLQRESHAITREGIELFDRKDYAAAIKKYEQALAVLPQNGWAHYELGYTRRTQLLIAAGIEPEPSGTMRINSDPIKSAEVQASFANSRRHDPLQLMAYQGSDQEVLRGCLALRKKAVPAIKKLNNATERPVIDEALQQVAEGLHEANSHELALAVRQVMAARRTRYDPTDHPFISASLRKLAPGPVTEEILKRLLGGPLALRQLTKLDTAAANQARMHHNPLDGKSYGPETTYLPQSPAKAADDSKKVKMKHLRLLTPQQELTEHATVDDLAKFAKQAERIAGAILEKSDKPFEVMVQFNCSRAGHKLQIAQRPQIANREALQELYEALQKMEKLPIKDGTLEFQIEWSVLPK